MKKQTLLDVIVVLIIPALLIVGYVNIGAEQLTSLVTFNMIGTIMPANTDNTGMTTKTAISELRSIKLDDSIFSDPRYQSLVDFSGKIGTSTAGRDYPFSTPEGIRTQLEKR
jgi:hypothetical protein